MWTVYKTDGGILGLQQYTSFKQLLVTVLVVRKAEVVENLTA